MHFWLLRITLFPFFSSSRTASRVPLLSPIEGEAQGGYPGDPFLDHQPYEDYCTIGEYRAVEAEARCKKDPRERILVSLRVLKDPAFHKKAMIS
jgi:hypothetical protein